MSYRILVVVRDWALDRSVLPKHNENYRLALKAVADAITALLVFH